MALNSSFSITSPLYPLNYPNSVVCRYAFTYTPYQYARLYVEITDIDIEESESCKADSLSIYDGVNQLAPLLDTICGKKKRIHYMASGTTFFIQFKSNSAVARKGFRARFGTQSVGMTFNIYTYYHLNSLKLLCNSINHG